MPETEREGAMKHLFFVLLFALICNISAQDAYIEMLRSDIRAKKVAIMTQSMNFSEEQAKVFWPIYREYNTEQEKISDERIKLIKSYIKFYENMTDKTAKVLMNKSLEIDQARLDLRKKYYKKLEKALPAQLAAKAMQLDNQINMLIRIQIDSELPLLK